MLFKYEIILDFGNLIYVICEPRRSQVVHALIVIVYLFDGVIANYFDFDHKLRVDNLSINMSEIIKNIITTVLICNLPT